MPDFQSKDGVGLRGQPRASTRRKSDTRSRVFRELVHIAAEQGASIPLGISTAQALQECLDRAVALWRFAADQVDQIAPPLDSNGDPEVNFSNLDVSEDPLFTVTPNPQGPDLVETNRYWRMEREARLEIEKLAAMMTQLGIAERVVRVKEAEAALYVGAIRDAAIEAGIPHEQVVALGQALRSRLTPSPGDADNIHAPKGPLTGTVSASAPTVQASRAIEKSIEETTD
jgi:hypothetical protein